MLEQIPAEILVNILSSLDPLEESLRTLPIVCRSWSQTFGPQNTRFWAVLAKSRNLSIGRRHAKRAFFQRYHQQKRARKNEADQIILQLGRRLERSDCVAHVRKQLESYPTLVHHRVSLLEHRTLLHLACWRGRTKAVKLLLEDYQASPWELDDSSASPLLVAAWSGHASVVRLLLAQLSSAKNSKKRQAYLEQKGVPPLTSSCGGRGPKTALCWAKRKGFQDVVRLLEKKV